MISLDGFICLKFPSTAPSRPNPYSLGLIKVSVPLSPYLFILSVELLSAAIKFHPNINGIKIDESEFLIS
jgi:hypothetical protein